VKLALGAKKAIEVGDFPTFRLAGLTFDVNVMASSLAVLVAVCALVFVLRRKLTDGVPGKLQLMFEMIVVDLIGSVALSAIGPMKYKRFVPIGVTIFIFILLSNWIGVLPTSLQPGISYDVLPPSAMDINLPLAMALFVIVWVHIESVRARGVGGYFKHYAKPSWPFAFINVIEELVKPITLAFRLFGNIFSGVLVLSIIVVLLPIYAVPPLELVWRMFDDLFIGGLQAYIFALLTILYFGIGMSHDDDDSHQPVLIQPVEQLA
jgi:F-type H+-transporting ATPase subunit a